MTIKISKILLIFLGLISTVALALPENCSIQWARSDISNLKIVLAKISTKSDIPVFFPPKYPFSKENPKLLHAFDTSMTGTNPNDAWQVSIDATADCHGTKVCNIGSLTAERKADIDRYYVTLPDNQKHAKELIRLKNGVSGYYTPFHIEAGGVNPTLEWKQSGVWYTLRWRIDSQPSYQKKVLMDMVDQVRLVFE
jgi:hypothetical protein